MQNNVNVKKMHKDRLRNMFDISRTGQDCSISMMDCMVSSSRPCCTIKKIMPTDNRIGYNLIHYHDYLELLCVEPNSDSFTHNIENKLFTQSAGDFVLIPNHVKHRVQDTTVSSVGYLLSFLPEYAAQNPHTSYPDFFFDWGNLLPWISHGDITSLILKIPPQKREELSAVTQKVSDLCFALTDEQKEKASKLIPGYSVELEAAFGKFIDMLAPVFYSNRSDEELAAFERYRPPMLAALGYIEEHLYEQIKLSDVCDRAGLKSAWFSKIFREIMGFTVMEYINFIRARKARSLLVNTDMPIGEISKACGFTSAIYFDRVFKKQTGCPPRTYRDEYIIEWKD